MKFQILTIFPEIFDSYLNHGMMRIAQEKKIIKVKPINLRDFCVDKHGTVDEKPYGGGPGQVLMVEPVFKSLQLITRTNDQLLKKKNKKIKSKIVLLSAKGKTWNQQLAQKYAKLDEIIFVCPRYEGHDERIKKLVDEEISIGNFILTGGELGALTIMDSITRLLPGVLGKQESLNEESHSQPGYLEYPHYTRPAVFSYKKNNKKQNLRVPKVLLSGHHQKINDWRIKNAKTQKFNKI